MTTAKAATEPVDPSPPRRAVVEKTTMAAREGGSTQAQPEAAGVDCAARQSSLEDGHKGAMMVVTAAG